MSITQKFEGGWPAGLIAVPYTATAVKKRNFQVVFEEHCLNLHSGLNAICYLVVKKTKFGLLKS